VAVQTADKCVQYMHEYKSVGKDKTTSYCACLVSESQVAEPSDKPTNNNQTICLETVTYQWLSILGLLVQMLQGCFHQMGVQ